MSEHGKEDVTLSHAVTRSESCLFLVTCGGEHVVDAVILAQTPLITERIVDDACRVSNGHVIVTQVVAQFLWRDESGPVMSATRQPAKNILGADDRQDESFHGAVDRGGRH